MNATRFIVGVILAVALAGCGHKEAIGVSAETSQNTGFRGEFASSKTKSESVSQSQKAISKQQVLTGIVDAVTTTRDLIDSQYYPHGLDETNPQVKVALNFNKEMRGAEWAWLNGGGYNHLGGSGQPYDGALFKDSAGLAAFGAVLVLPSKYEDWFGPWDALIKKFKSGDTLAGKDFILRATALEIINMATEPHNAWPMLGDLNQSESMILFMNRQMRAINFTNLLTDEIARTMPQSYKNPSDFRHDFLEAMIKIPDADYYAMFAQADRDAGKVTMKSLSIKGDGGAPNWLSGPLQYTSENGGWVYRVGGQVIFGNGYINGDLREVDESSALEVSMKKERADRESESYGNDQATKGSASVK
jgi:hypothetical protein